MKHEERTATLKSLKKKLRTSRKKYNKCYYKLQDGWMSTSHETPEKGGIFKDIPFVSVSFVDKYGQFHKGILHSVTYEKTQDKVFATVLSNRVNPFSDCGEDLAEGCYNCMISLHHLTPLSGSLPKLPAKPTSIK